MVGWMSFLQSTTPNVQPQLSLFNFFRKKLQILECDKYQMNVKQQSLEFDISDEYYLMADIYYVNTTCSIKEEWHWIPVKKLLPVDLVLEQLKVVANPDHMTTLAIMFETATEDQIEKALIDANNSVESAIDRLLNLTLV